MSLEVIIAAQKRPGGALPIKARTGPVRLVNRAFSDDGGAWNPLGASLFWALWGERHDPDRLDANLAYLSQHGFDFVRMLGMVGAPSWEDRVIDPYAPDYWQVADRLLSRLERHGLRAHVTVFADAQVMMPGSGDRQQFARGWAMQANMRRDRVLSLEVCNEHWQNGFEDITQLRAIGKTLTDHTDVAVALSSTYHDPSMAMFEKVYAGSTATLCTQHYDRDCSKADGPWRPVRQPWGYPSEYGSGLPAAVMNNEPIGPDSSVAEDADPMRMAMAYVSTFVCANAGYVYHCGAGIRGGGYADLAKGRLANVYDYPQEIATAFKAMRALLPDGVANWTRHNSQWESCPFAGFNLGVDDGRLMRFYAATSGNQMVGVVLDIKAPITVTARVGMDFDVINPLDGSVLASVSLDAGNVWTCPADQPGYVFLGKTR